MPRSRFLRIALIAMFLSGLLYPSTCLASDVSMVKNTISSLDKSMTLGKALDSYQYFEKSSWEQKTTERGQEFVEFRAYYKNDILVRHGIKILQAAVDDFQNYAESFIEYLNKSPFRLEFKAQFMLSADKKEFSPIFIGFEDEDKVTQQAMQRRLQTIYKNVPFSYVPTKAFIYHFKRYVLHTVGVKSFKFAKAVQTNMSLDASPIALFQLQHVAFNDDTLSMEAIVEYEITDITQKSGTVHVSINEPPALYAEINSLKGSYAVLQKGTMRLQSRKDDTEYNKWTFLSQDNTGRNLFGFAVHALNPLRTGQMDAIIGGFSENVQGFLNTQKQALAEKEQADRERAQAQQAANEQFRAQARAARSTPYTGPAAKKSQPAKEQQPKMVTEELWLRSVKSTSPDLTLDMCIKETDACGTFIIKKGTSPYLVYEQNKSIFQKGLILKAEYNANTGMIKLIQQIDFHSASIPQGGFTSGSQTKQTTTPSNKASQAQSPKEIKTIPGVYVYQVDGFDGQLMLHAKKDSIGKYFMNILTSNADGNTCNFEGKCLLKGEQLVCSNDDINDNNENYIVIQVKDNNILDIIKSYGILCGVGAHIGGIYMPKCLDKTLETKTVSGTYLGWFEAEEGVNTIGIKTSGSNEELYIVASEEEAIRFFGKAKGQKISVTYDVEQTWIDNTCGTLDILKTGKALQ